MGFLFDTDAISEVLKKRPAPLYLQWIEKLPRVEQFTSAVVIGEMFRGAYRSAEPLRHVESIESRVLAVVTVLPYDVAVARVYGQIQASLSRVGRTIADADLQIAATAIHHGLTVVTGNLQHFERIPGVRVNRVLADARSGLA
ncbi:MAG TPA: type II toxin-antitoxin system VapC family toxin [Thermoanaerobaculia bacterium]|jgi:predicted nucleic acid-binding protein|nr:type II toxin-antitoxin system VapC family toxin [Thermoanaerobaculia bacterium]